MEKTKITKAKEKFPIFLVRIGFLCTIFGLMLTVFISYSFLWLFISGIIFFAIGCAFILKKINKEK